MALQVYETRDVSQHFGLLFLYCIPGLLQCVCWGEQHLMHTICLTFIAGRNIISLSRASSSDISGKGISMASNREMRRAKTGWMVGLRRKREGVLLNLHNPPDNKGGQGGMSAVVRTTLDLATSRKQVTRQAKLLLCKWQDLTVTEKPWSRGWICVDCCLFDKHTQSHTHTYRQMRHKPAHTNSPTKTPIVAENRSI